MSIGSISAAGGIRQAAANVLRPSRRSEAAEALKSVLPLDGAGPRDGVPVSSPELAAAFALYVRTARLFIRGGLRLVSANPLRAAHPRPHRAVMDEQTVFACRAAAWRLHALGRTIFGDRKCLCESLSLWRALRRLGFPAELVIGHPVVAALDDPDGLHAWVEIGGMVVDQRTDLVLTPSLYVDLFRLKDEHDWGSHASLGTTGGDAA